MAEPSIRQLQADLKAANAEASDLMQQISILKEDRRSEGKRVEAEYAGRIANMAVLMRHLSDLVAEMAGKIASR